MPSKRKSGAGDAGQEQRRQSPKTPPTSISSVSATAGEVEHNTKNLDRKGGASGGSKRRVARLGGRPVERVEQKLSKESDYAGNSGGGAKSSAKRKKNSAVRSSSHKKFSSASKHRREQAETGSSPDKSSSSDSEHSSSSFEEEEVGEADREEGPSDGSFCDVERAENKEKGQEQGQGQGQDAVDQIAPEALGGRKGFGMRKRKCTLVKPEYLRNAQARAIEDDEQNDIISKKLKCSPSKGRKYLQTVKFEGLDLGVGDDVYIKRKDIGRESSEESDAEIEHCRICGVVDEQEKLECDNCLGGYHLTCLDPPLSAVPEGDWFCARCLKSKDGRGGQVPDSPPVPRRKTTRERFLAKEIWAARIRRIWRNEDGRILFSGQWFVLPEETHEGRLPRHGRREVFLSNHHDKNEIELIHRQCWVMSPEEFEKQVNGGDDVFMCRYLYDVDTTKLTPIPDLDCELAWNSFTDRRGRAKLTMPREYKEECSVIKKTVHKKKLNRSPRRVTVSSPEDAAETKETVTKEPEDDSKSGSPSPSTVSGSSSGKTEAKRAGRSTNAEQVAGTPPIQQSVADSAQQVEQESERAVEPDAPKVDDVKVAPGTPPGASKELLYRTRQKRQIETILTDALVTSDNSSGTCLYISGGPGAGKKTVLQHVIRDLQAKVATKVLPPFQYVQVAASGLGFPEHVYLLLLEKLTGKEEKSAWEKALARLEKKFSDIIDGGCDQQPVVVTIDGLDALVTQEKSVLKNILEWPLRGRSRLILIGIGNKQDLPELALPEITSHTGVQKIHLTSYSQKQVEGIVRHVLDNADAFEPNAIELAAREVYKVQGDVKRTLQLCQQALAHSQQRASASGSSNAKSVKLSDMKAAIEMMYNTEVMKIIRTNGKLTKLFLVALVSEHNRTSIPETTFEKLFEACATMCEEQGDVCPSNMELAQVGARLSACHLLICERAGNSHDHTKLRLAFPSDDLVYALLNDAEAPWLSSYLR